MMNFSEIGCGTNTDCPNQRACINALCIDPCAQSDVCAEHQECQVDNHRVVCIQGKSFDQCASQWSPSQFNVMPKFVFSCLFSTARDPVSCDHCSGGTCDPITGACVKGNFNVTLFHCSSEFIFVDHTRPAIKMEFIPIIVLQIDKYLETVFTWKKDGKNYKRFIGRTETQIHAQIDRRKDIVHTIFKHLPIYSKEKKKPFPIVIYVYPPKTKTVICDGCEYLHETQTFKILHTLAHSTLHTHSFCKYTKPDIQL